MADELKGKTAVVTGASSGIGAATARDLAELGADVALLARRSDRIEDLAKELRDEHGVKALAITADVTSTDDLAKAASQVADELGGADILVNNAGQMLLGPFGPDQADEMETMVELNVLGSMRTLQAFLGQLTEGDGLSDLVNLSSVAGRTAKPGSSVYNATKWAINGWSEALRQELLGKVRVTMIEPGAVSTELTDHITDSSAKEGADQMYESAIPPEDIAEVIAFVVSRPGRTSINEVLIRPSTQEL